MAEETPTPAGATSANPGTQAPAAPAINILAQYVKDLSFENPGVSGGGQVQPNIDLGIDVGATAHKDGNNIFEISIRVQAKAQVEQEVMFLLELDYAGMFQLNGFKAEEMEPVLLIECPRLIFPFARRVISDITRDGGFPPLLIDPIDFRNLYLSQKQRQQQAQQSAPTANAGPMSSAIPNPQT
jgi:preprotein translocase subunit SecB